MRILLIQPSLFSLKALEEAFEKKMFRSTDEKRSNIPLGLLHIGSVLKQDGFDTRIIDLDNDLYSVLQQKDEKLELQTFYKKYLIDYIEKFKPEIIGLSGNFNTNVTFIRKCCQEIRNEFKNILIVLGGHYPTNSYREIIQSDINVDYIILGEGEKVMLDLANLVRKGDMLSLEQHPNIVTRKNILNDQSIVKTAAIVANLNALPSTDYSLLQNLEDYLLSFQDMRIIVPRKEQTRTIAIMTSRGCPFRCTYCSSHKVHGRKIRAFTVERILKELRELVEKHNVNTIIFEDDLFTYSRKRTIELCRRIDEKFPGKFFIEFPNGIAVKTLNEEVIYWLAKAGMKQINLAIETGSQYVQDVIIKKKLKLELVQPVVNLLKKHDVLVRAYFIIGFPGETIEMMRETKDFAKNLELDWSVFSFASPVAGSELYETARMNNNLVGDGLDTSTYFDCQLKSDDWSYKEVEEIWNEANIEANFLENYNIRKGNYEKSKLIYADILTSYPNHLFASYCLWIACKGLGDKEGVSLTEKRINKIIMSDEGSIGLLTKYNLTEKEPFTKLLNTFNAPKKS